MNAKDELMEAVVDLSRIKCAYIHKKERHWEAVLKVNYSQENLAFFLNQLDGEYEIVPYHQSLFGTIWLNDGTWIKRTEYDGDEFWERQKCPPIPEDCF
jgi:hypothetical protein